MVKWESLEQPKLANIVDSLNQMHGEDQLGKAWPKDFTAKKWGIFFQEQDESYAALLNHELVGGFGFRTDPDLNNIWFYYFILPNHRGKKIGKNLLDELQNTVIIRDQKKIILNAICNKKNNASIQCLSSSGYLLMDEINDQFLFQKVIR